MFVIEDGDHSFRVPKRGGETMEQTIARVADEIVRFVGPGDR
jgi:hypothetical protein